ncbi:hypothetical protein BDN70DRAFT_909513 [Pholiota conissans]|uniref:CxC6 like cysteine cluster associated with KDZ domain-containing protein n=1 Tax=Pholiota conissans TaxID=109636 RepID=A0A9P5YKX4_9AGAR|nr:hypothetical protein BDN70DRAFT_909513 [Pholiota conissans]
MVVIDGIVMGPVHCAYENCPNDLANARGGAFCITHEAEFGTRCRVMNCNSERVGDTMACNAHAAKWRRHVKDKSKTTLSGIRRIIRRPERQQALPQPHDDNQSEADTRNNYFSPNRFYCVETLCTPCGLALAWTLFDKSESPTKILNWLESLYLNKDTRPSYIAIDKACQVLRTALTTNRWDDWKQTTQFIVDSYHYINHRANVPICTKWCNPASSDGSAPNLVRIHVDENGVEHEVWEFNTESCEQLNSFMGGFNSILKRMVAKNFKWFLHTMLVFYAKCVLARIKEKERKQREAEGEEVNGSDNDDDAATISQSPSPLLSESGSSQEDSSEDEESESEESNFNSDDDEMWTW